MGRNARQRWKLGWVNTFDGKDAERMGERSRSANRHEFDKHKALELYKKGLSDINIAVRLGVSKGDVYRWRRLNGYISNMTPKQETSDPSTKTEQK